jgi:lipid A oxidase
MHLSSAALPAALAAAACALLATTAPAAAGDVELSFYFGVQDAPHSRVHINDPGGLGQQSFLSDWEGRSFSMPPYYGVRATWWQSDRLGFALDYNHAKVYASDDTREDNGFSVLEFTDGLNIITADVLYRWPGPRRWTPYVGGGLGISVPHVEVTTAGGRTFKYEYGGPAVALMAGVSYRMNDTWSLFGEYKGTYSKNDVDLDNGGSLKTDIVTNAVNLGVSFRF